MLGAKLIGKLNKLRSEGVLCDVVIECGNQEFNAHRAVLAASCEYFQVLFTTSMQEQNSKLVKLDVPSSIAEELFTFLYTGEINLSAANSKELLIAADYLMIEELKLQCEDYMAAAISIDTCLQNYSLAVDYNCQHLSSKSENLILKNFGAVRERAEFMALGFQHLERILNSDDLLVENEEEVYETIVSWVNFQPEERELLFEKLFKCIRLCSISVQFVTSNIAKNPMVRKRQVCMSFVFQRIQKELNKDDNDQTLQPRKCLRTENKAIVCLGGIASGKPLKETVAYIPYHDTLTHLEDIPVEREEHVVVMGNDVLYVIGGIKTPNSIDCYNPLLNSWSTVAVLPERSIASAGVFLDGKIFIIGGSDGFHCVSTVQCCDLSNKSVEILPTLPFARKAMNAIALNGDIYVIGGCTYNNDSLNTVERMNLRNENKWEKMASLLNRRKFACAEVLSNGQILVVGGYQDTNPTALRSCEVYNQMSNDWHEICDLVVPRAAAGMAYLGRRVYIIGGRSDRTSTDTMEYYDEESGKWSMMTTRFPNPFAWLQCGVVSLQRSENCMWYRGSF